jgi:hypothetical protein
MMPVRPCRLHPHFNLKDGGNIREQLLTLSDFDLSCSYSILESPMGVRNYIATLKLTPITYGERCFIEWSAEFDCAPEREREADLVAMACFRPASIPSNARSPGARLHGSGQVRKSTVIDAPVNAVWNPAGFQRP